MKAMLLRHDESRPGAMPLVTVFPDSAITLHGRPVVIPELPGGWSFQLAPAFRVGRLGKAIAPRFASRYLDAMTIAAILVNDTPDAGIASMMALCDNALTLGRWLPLDADTAMRYGAYEALATLSRYATIKTGDVIMPRVISQLPADGDRLDAALDGTSCLSRRIIGVPPYNKIEKPTLIK